MIKAVLIEDEAHCLETLKMLVSDYCPAVQIMDLCNSAERGLAAIDKYTPDLVFLDIEMPSMNGFELLEQFKEIPFAVIFTTSYHQYAIKAIRFSALDYLLKPIAARELVLAVNRVKTQKAPPSAEQFRMLMDQVQHKTMGFTKIAIPTIEGFELIPADQVLHCEADDNYTYFFLKNKNRVTACRTLKEIEEQLQVFPFFTRVHHSYLVNMNEVTKYVRSVHSYLIMSDGSAVQVSRRRKDALMKWF